MINVLNNQETNGDKQDVEEEILVSAFRIKFLVISDDNITQVDEKPSSIVEKNCLCVFTSKNVLIFRINNEDLFQSNSEFDKCLKKEYSFNINYIEFIDISLGQHYFQLEIILSDNSDRKKLVKFVTLDVYQTQAYINNLLSNFFFIHKFNLKLQK